MVRKTFSDIVFWLFFLVIFSSCGRRTSSPVYRQSGDMSVDEVRTDLVEDFPVWSSVYMPVKLKVSGPLGLSLSGRATMICGEKLYLSFRMLGMEVASLYADRDSVFIADRYHKWLFAEGIADVSARFGLTLANLQDVLLGRPALLGAENITAGNVGRFIVTPVGGGQGGYAVYSQVKNTDIQYNYIVNRVNESDISVTSLAVTPSGGAPLECSYADPYSTPAGWLPGKMRFSAVKGDVTLTVELEWNMRGAEWGTDRGINWRRPVGYREINAASLPEMLKES